MAHRRKHHGGGTSRTVAGLCVALAAVTSVAGCGAAGDAADGGGQGEAGGIPPGLSVEMYQTRTDTGPRRIEIAITNGTDGPVVIERLVFDSTQFDGPGQWEKDSTRIVAGATVDLPVLLPPPDCEAADIVHTVEFDYVLSDGTEGTATAEPVDRLDRLPAIRLEDCIAESVADIAILTADTLPYPITVGGLAAVGVDVTVEPTGADGSVTFVEAGSTTLLMMADPATGTVQNRLPLGITVNGTDEPSVITLTVAPGRCDPHAIQEDKRGTIFPVEVITPDGEGRIDITTAGPVRSALYDVVIAACGTG
jgi:hypothetical protein